MLMVAVILAALAAAGFAYSIVAKQVCKSNNFGDDMGTVNDFSRGTWRILSRRDYRRKKKEWMNDKFFLQNQSSGLL